MNYRLSNEEIEKELLVSCGAPLFNSEFEIYRECENRLVPLLEERDATIKSFRSSVAGLANMCEGLRFKREKYENILKECRELLEELIKQRFTVDKYDDPIAPVMDIVDTWNKAASMVTKLKENETIFEY